jgi:hypothetical protein
MGSISRLGILPVYPPMEDFRVGDVWGLVADEEQTLLLNKAVRITHIDLHDDIAADLKTPVFENTIEQTAEQTFRHQLLKETPPPGSGITASIAAFPGIVISHNRAASGSAGFGFGIFGGSREDDDAEEIRIPTAETYGAPIVPAFAKLDAFCGNSQTSLYCTDELVRRAIAYATGDRVLATANGQYLAKLQLSFIVRTYATREIVQRRTRKDSRGGQLAVAANALSSPAPAAPGNSPGLEAPASPSAAKADPQGSAAISAQRSNETQIGIQQVFGRPIVFGYRAITIRLAPSTPRPGASQ